MFHRNFFINIIDAMTSQLLEALDSLTGVELNKENLQAVPVNEGVYILFHNGNLVYVGKANDLQGRLGEHLEKITGRHNILPTQMTFVCMSVGEGWTALAPESTLINALKKRNIGLCTWNGAGFGPHDPGRDRETTNKPSEGFDSNFRIKCDLPCDWIDARQWNVLDLLLALKRKLPYLLRYQTSGHWTKGHPDYNDVSVLVPQTGMQAKDLLAKIVHVLPGWQATLFPSHMILYKEKRDYKYGDQL